MATALIKGAISSNCINSNEIIVSDVNDIALEKMANNGVSTTKDTVYLVENSEFVLFAVKPQSLSEVLSQISSCDPSKFISIMAGIKKEKIKKTFPTSKVARCMPNTPCSIGFGAVGLDVSDFTDDNDLTFIKNLFLPLANVVLVPEEKLNAVTGVSGSSPAYFYLFLNISKMHLVLKAINIFVSHE